MFKRILLSSAVAMSALSGSVSVQAATLAEAQAALCPVGGGAPTQTVSALATSTTVNVLVQALLNCGKSFADIISALRAANLSDQAISNALYATVPAAQLASLDAAVLTAGLPLPATAAGPGGATPGVGGGTSTLGSPFVSSTTGGGGGRAATASGS